MGFCQCLRHFRCFRSNKPATLLLIMILFGALPSGASAFDILLGTDDTGTFSHFVGRTLCRVINSHGTELNCRTVPAPGDVDNLTNLRGGSLDLALADARMLLDAINRKGRFEFLDITYDNLRALLPMYDIPITLVVREDAGIDTLDDLSGKRLNAGAPLSPQHAVFERIMSVKNWSRQNFSLLAELSASQSQDTMAFCHGTTQAMLHIGVHPDPSLQQLFKLCGARLTDMNDSDIDQLVQANAAFSKLSLAPGTYTSHTQRVTTFGTRAVLVVSQDLDAQTAVTVMDAMYRQRQRLQKAHPSLTLFPIDTAWTEAAGITLHPGVTQFLAEQGM